MLSKLRSHLTFANVTSLLALFIALGGTAYAVNTIRSEDIVNGEVKRADIGGNAVTADELDSFSVGTGELATDGVTSSKLADGSIGGRAVLNNALTGSDLDESTLALPRVRGMVFPNNCSDPPDPRTCDVERNRGITSVERLNTGTYCVTPDPATGVDPQIDVPQVAVEYNNSGFPAGNTSAMPSVSFSSPDCNSATDFLVYTQRIPSLAADGQRAADDNGVGFNITIP